MNGDNFFYEAKGMAQYILEGHNLQETADEFGVQKTQVRRRLKLIGYTVTDLIEARKLSKNKQSS